MATRRNLEITQNLSGGTDNTLAEVLDHTATAMGSRMLAAGYINQCVIFQLLINAFRCDW